MAVDVKIRSAVVEDAAFIGRCVMAAAHLNDFPPVSEYDEIFTELSKREDTLYSYLYARILTVDSIPVGTMVSYPGDIYAEARAKTFFQFTDSSKEVIEATDIETFPGEWYLDSLAILPAYRHFGFGSMLIRDAITCGSAHGYTRFSLIAEKASQSLQDYYSGFGFKPCREITFFAEPYVYMVKEV